MATDNRKVNTNWWVFLIASLYLTLTCLYKAILPGSGEWPSNGVAIMSMVFQAAMTVGLIGLRSELKTGLPAGDRRRDFIQLLFWTGLVAGVLLLLFRFGSHGGWYTGHLREFRLTP
jgi:hypothetical protein